MSIEGLGDRTGLELEEDIAEGGRFVVYFWVVSPILVTFKRPTKIRYIDSRSSRLAPAIGPTLLSVALGWWGIPWGILYTIEAVVVNLSGGKNVTQDVMRQIVGHDSD